MAWNALIKEGKGEGLLPLTAPVRRTPYVLAITAFPQSFQDDYARFERRLAGGGRAGGRFGAGGGPKRPLKPKSIATRLFSLRQAASALVIEGIVRPEELTSLRDLVDPIDRAGEILDFYAARTKRETGGQLATVAAALHMVGTHYAELDAASVKQLLKWCNEAGHRKQNGLTPKVRERLRALIQPQYRALLLALPAELMRRARALDPTDIEAARMARVAAILEILLICPMRLHNLRHLRADQHFRRLDPKGQRVTHIVVDGADVKNREPIEWPVPRASAELIETYLHDFRPTLADPRNPYVFPGRRLGAYSDGGLGKALRDTVYADVRVRVHVHLFRHFAAWLHLQRYPGHYEDVRRMLGHRSLQTTINAYIGFETAVAAERFDTVVLQERKAGRAIVAQAWGGKRKPKGSAGKGAQS
ncbi:tyrosine-type recombinase/integrase [Muricoccus pecuniae]|uniref:Integrase n=1 Tax=Muricoccus pecuniae TaxID=693023 RepID=A0A840Y9A0_9PROT|nr:tyrosine-type recombinase/integrase [Roseomonas pecuniae]MBB5696510.1 integrase [Roseomonas pecuniae]